MQDEATIKVEGHVKIIDVDTGEVVLDKKNAIHFGNLAAAIVTALSGSDAGHVRYMAFGNGGTRVTAEGEVIYREPNVSIIRNPDDSLYNETFRKEIDNTTQNKVETILGSTNFSDIKVTVTLAYDETGLDQQIIDQADSFAEGSKDSSVFDEIALYVGVPGISGSLDQSSAVMITHVIFHPIQKSTNRSLQIQYTVRIQMG